jgi:hypothetical protein
MSASSDREPWIIRRLRPWHWRHPRFVLFTEILVSVWLIVAGALLCSIGDWMGAFLFVAAALILWLVHLFQRSLDGRR